VDGPAGQVDGEPFGQEDGGEPFGLARWGGASVRAGRLPLGILNRVSECQVRLDRATSSLTL
jgi:hypothetical protein